MKIRLSELRQLIKTVVAECYGWPVETEIDLFGALARKGDTKLPKGPNTRTDIKESFQRVTSRELSAWKNGDYSEINESPDVTEDPCDECGNMFPSDKLVEVEGKYMCQSCAGH
jgi:formylmethanofuran dehydrogenase subunit E